jgi:hypothetical protein
MNHPAGRRKNVNEAQEAEAMTLDITDQERDFLLELLEARRTEMLRELHHTDTLDYKELLRQRIELLERMREKLDVVSRRP